MVRLTDWLGGRWRQRRKEPRMGKWIERAAIAATVVIVVVTLIGMHSTWRECAAAGGKTVRGLFGLECIK
jgi:hypothetical protein